MALFYVFKQEQGGEEDRGMKRVQCRRREMLSSCLWEELKRPLDMLIAFQQQRRTALFSEKFSSSISWFAQRRPRYQVYDARF